ESLELLNFAGNGGPVNAEPFGQFAYAKGRFTVGVKFVQQRRPREVESDARFLEQLFVSSGLVERAGQDLQTPGDPIKILVRRREGLVLIRQRSCFQHTTIVAVPVAVAHRDLFSSESECQFIRRGSGLEVATSIQVELGL